MENIVDSHRGGYDRIAFDIAPYINKEELQEIVISVWDPVDSGTQPRGKQVLNPSGIWYTSVTGIWQTVWLEPLPKQYIEVMKIVTDIDRDTVALKAICVGVDKTFQFDAMVFDRQNKISEGNASTMKLLKLAVPQCKTMVTGFTLSYTI